VDQISRNCGPCQLETARLRGVGQTSSLVRTYCSDGVGADSAKRRSNGSFENGSINRLYRRRHEAPMAVSAAGTSVVSAK
jgi:hypothetical protein